MAPGRVSIRFDTRPSGALVSVDGVPISGSTPLTITQESGRHRLVFTRAGYEPRVEDANFVAGIESYTYVMQASAPVVGAPVPEPTPERVVASKALITFSSNPPGARVTVDGRDMGFNTEGKLYVDEGAHTLRLTLPGYRTVERSFTVVAGGDHRVHTILVKDEVAERIPIAPEVPPTVLSAAEEKSAIDGILEAARAWWEGLEADAAARRAGPGVFVSLARELIDLFSVKIVGPGGETVNMIIPAGGFITKTEATLGKEGAKKLAVAMAEENAVRITDAITRDPKKWIAGWEAASVAARKSTYAELKNAGPLGKSAIDLISRVTGEAVQAKMKNPGWFTKAAVASFALLGTVGGVLGISGAATYFNKEVPEKPGIGVYALLKQGLWQDALDQIEIWRKILDDTEELSKLPQFAVSAAFGMDLMTDVRAARVEADMFEAVASAGLAEEERKKEVGNRITLDANVDEFEIVKGPALGLFKPGDVIKVEEQRQYAFSAVALGFEPKDATSSFFKEDKASVIFNFVPLELPTKPGVAAFDVYVRSSRDGAIVPAVIRLDGSLVKSYMGTAHIETTVGEHTLLAEHGEYATRALDLELAEGLNLPRTILLPPKVPEELITPKEELARVPVIISAFSWPEAVVSIAGYGSKSTPAKFEVPAGTYTLRFSAPGYKETTRTVFVEAGVPKSVSVTLERVVPEVVEGKAIISVTTIPTRAYVYVDGILQKYPTPVRIEVEPGTRVVRIEKEGYLPVEFTLEELAAEQQIPIFRELEEEPEVPPEEVAPPEALWRVDIVTNVTGAKILVNDSFTGKYAPDYVILRSGTWFISVEKSGYFPAGQEIVLGA